MKSIKLSDVFIALIVIAVVMLIIIPLDTFMLDVLLVINIAVSLVILLVTLYAEDSLAFSAFPSLLLLVTLFRLALSISSTKLILGNNGDAGAVIETFGNFVIGSNLVVGFIIFLIILAIQFIVITKGAERVAEVAARFTLDAMPGKQMAIDADLNSGLIDEQQAKDRRSKIQREADFYGAMDGASKFIKGDAIIAIIVTVINAVGGLLIGMLGPSNMEIGEVVRVYTLATVGDGLVSQIPALMVSTAMGIIVTRAASEGSLGGDLQKQLFNQPVVLIVTGGMLTVLSLVPGMPLLTMNLVAIVFYALGIMKMRAGKKTEEVEEVEVAEQIAIEKRKPENVTTLLQVDPIELEFGYGIIPLVDTSQGGDLLDRVVMIRRQCALDLGIIVPVIRLRDNIQLNTSEYVIKIKGVEVARGEVMADHYLALNGGKASGSLKGIETVEPAFGMPAMWVSESEREKAELLGYSTIDPPSVIATHLTEIVKRFAFELMGRQQVQMLIDNLRRQQPALVDEVVPKLFALGEVQKVLCNLLKENVSIRDMATIIETLGDYGNLTRDTDLLTEYVRQNLKRAISKRFVPDNRAHVITLEPDLEQLILDRVKQTEQGSYVAMEPEYVQRLFGSLKQVIERMSHAGNTPIVLTAPVVRKYFKRLTEQVAPELTVLSYNELESNVEVYADGVVGI